MPGNGDGTFERAELYAPAGRSPQNVVVADFNGDDKQDLAVSDFYDSSFVSPTGDVSVFLGKGDGTFQPAGKATVGDQAAWVAVGDFNKDGKLDLAIPSPNTSRIEVMLGNGNGTFQSPATYAVLKLPSWIAAADFSGDGILDLVTANYVTKDVAILLGKGDGTFGAPASFPVDGNASSGAVADLNGDGKLDLVITSANSGNIFVLLGNGDGTFGPALPYAIGKNPDSVTAVDLDGDGKLDLAVVDSQPATQANGLAVLPGNGDGTFQSPVYFDAGPQPKFVTFGDLNKDGKNDLAVSNALRDGTVDVTVLLNTASSLANVSAAGYANGPVAPDTIIAAFGGHLATGTEAATTALVSNLLDTTVQVKDASGAVASCLEYFVSQGQVNYLLPSDTATGAATVTITAGDGTVTTGTMQVAAVAPGLFTLNESALAAALVLRVQPGNVQTVENVYQLGSDLEITPKPIDLGPATDEVYLLLYGTGIRHRSSQSNVFVTLGSATLPVLFADKHPT